MSVEEEDSCSIYSFTRDDVDAVNVVNWYELFKHLSPKTICLPIPPEVLKYLKSDGMVMPQNTHTTAHVNYGTSSSANNEDDDGDDNTSWASISENGDDQPSIPSEFLQQLRQQQPSQDANGYGEELWERGSNSSSEEVDTRGGQENRKGLEVEKFHEFDSLLDASIKELGGAVLPKINRKSPKDATWIAFNRSLKCYNPGDIYLLLKTSDVVSQVLEDPYKDCSTEHPDGASSHHSTSTTPYVLVLKEWNDSWGPEMEFRCFICSNQLTAICQRDLDTCYSTIVKRKDKLLVNIQNFFVRNILQQFPIDYYVMDIICHPNGEVYVVDFDVFGLSTDPLLFTYQELESLFEDLENNTKNRHGNGDNRSGERSTVSKPFGQPCLRFLTESRNFRARKTASQSALTNDVMTYMRQSLPNK
ncbi:hypothetical protein Ocin01_03535 [Orchesella cincta]|uniref:Uncharacterized protein n=1 Tax=Orchesella cincta TaxID=48709 RepID=A0A1D2NCY4_ORCCI|nr:hypothetical protein Ocin01_03535 [Orchesella cincta]